MTEVTVPAPHERPADGLDVVYVLCLLQVAFLLLAAIGEMLLMGANPAYLLLPVVKGVLLLVFGTSAVRRRRWALRALVVLSWITLAGFAIGLLVGLLPMVDTTVNLVGLLTNVALPVAMIWLCWPHLRVIRAQRRQERQWRLAQRQAAQGWPPPAWPAPVPPASVPPAWPAQDPYTGPTVPSGQTGGSR